LRVGAESPQFDRVLAVQAGRAYVESYMRQHPEATFPHLDWRGATVEYVPSKHGHFDGYVAAFFPAIGGVGGGFTIFNAAGNHMFPTEFGYSNNLAVAMANFKRQAADGSLDRQPLELM
jgi:hypothetical protein